MKFISFSPLGKEVKVYFHTIQEITPDLHYYTLVLLKY
ncbi:hypothetical protein SZ39_2039 [Bacillus mycoides]|nr:hypothetical protein SZ39_2039 [Bacillus mycoides]OSY10021.1 hypothetical protein S2E19_02583 [Bacillus mycoides]